MGLEIITNDDGSVSFKRGDEVLEADQIEQALDREKNLKAGYDKKFQELAQARKDLEEEAAVVKAWNAELEKHPELQSEIDAVVAKAKDKSVAKGNEAMTSPEILAMQKKIDALVAEKESEKQQASIAGVRSFWDNELKGLSEKYAITDTEDIDTLRRAIISEVSLGASIEDVKAFADKKAKRFSKDYTIAKAKNDKTPVGDKSGGGGRTQPPTEKPAIGSAAHKESLKEFFFKRKQTT